MAATQKQWVCATLISVGIYSSYILYIFPKLAEGSLEVYLLFAQPVYYFNTNKKQDNSITKSLFISRHGYVGNGCDSKLNAIKWVPRNVHCRQL